MPPPSPPCRTWGRAGRTVPGIALPDGTKRLVVSANSHFTPVEGFEPIPDGYKGLTAAALLVDGNGRIVKFTSDPGAIGVDGTQLDIPLTAAGGQALEGPLHLIGLDVGLTIAGVPNGMGQGQVDITSLATSPDVDGGTVTPLEIAPGGHWTLDEGGNRTPLKPTAGPKITLPVNSISQFFDDLWTLSYLPARDAAPLPTIAGSSFLAKTGASVGDKLHASVFGVPVTLDILAKVDGFPPLDQSKPFVLVDDLALGLARAGAGGSVVDPDEWWLSVDPAKAASVDAALRAAPIEATSIVDRSAVAADLAGDPLGLGVIGILGLGSLAALVFASIGFLVSVTVSISERIGEFALLKALGLGPRQLLLWLTIENLVLLVTGLVLGTLLGLLLAWLVLPFATLTNTGVPPVPAPVIVVPPEAAIPTIALAAILVLATVVLAKRQLPSARTSAVLRARDE